MLKKQSKQPLKKNLTKNSEGDQIFIVVHEPKVGKSKLLKMWSAKYSRDQELRYR